ncbi:MAG: hypothetical protein GY772_23235 [bacterium]|nr:hypothetical protein [bacterium]
MASATPPVQSGGVLGIWVETPSPAPVIGSSAAEAAPEGSAHPPAKPTGGVRKAGRMLPAPASTSSEEEPTSSSERSRPASSSERPPSQFCVAIASGTRFVTWVETPKPGSQRMGADGARR